MEDTAMDVVEGQAAAAPLSGPPDAVPSAPLNGTGSTSAAWNTPKHREEVDAYRTRLTDQGFNTADFGDPLTAKRPLAKIYSRAFPEETEASLRRLIEKQ
ncbi:hypothetical protein SEUCBS139899_005455 [Sporothrix eucalyptigena]|uniref:Uncharacterized protein n=1 Tax=Sporothrix eucalyptigena TaxID=1812306 RepID=A0ABP0BM32_9PEZI